MESPTPFTIQPAPASTSSQERLARYGTGSAALARFPGACSRRRAEFAAARPMLRIRGGRASVRLRPAAGSTPPENALDQRRYNPRTGDVEIHARAAVLHGLAGVPLSLHAPGHRRGSICLSHPIDGRSGRLDIDAFHEQTIELATGGGHYYISANQRIVRAGRAGLGTRVPRLPRCAGRVPFALGSRAFFSGPLRHVCLNHGRLRCAHGGRVGVVRLSMYAPAMACVAHSLALRVWQPGLLLLHANPAERRDCVRRVVGISAGVRTRLLADATTLAMAAIGLLLGIGVLVDFSMRCRSRVCVSRPARRTSHHPNYGLSLVAAAAVPIVWLGWYQFHVFGNFVLPAHSELCTRPRATTRRENVWHHDAAVVPTSRLPGDAEAGTVRVHAVRSWPLVTRGRNAARPVPLPQMNCGSFSGLRLFLYAAVLQASEASLFGPRYLMPIVPFICLLVGRTSAVAPFLDGDGVDWSGRARECRQRGARRGHGQRVLHGGGVADSGTVAARRQLDRNRIARTAPVSAWST